MRNPVKIACSIAFVLSGLSASAESLRYEWLAIQGSGHTTSIRKDVRTYSLKDVLVDVDEEPVEGRGGHWSKRLPLFGPYEIEVDVYERPIIDGFGIVINEHGNPEGFSWNWFDKVKDDIFVQRQGKGRIRVRMTGMGHQQVASIEFLDDLLLSYTDHRMPKGQFKDTHFLTIGKGSVLRVAP